MLLHVPVFVFVVFAGTQREPAPPKTCSYSLTRELLHTSTWKV